MRLRGLPPRSNARWSCWQQIGKLGPLRTGWSSTWAEGIILHRGSLCAGFCGWRSEIRGRRRISSTRATAERRRWARILRERRSGRATSKFAIGLSRAKLSRTWLPAPLQARAPRAQPFFRRPTLPGRILSWSWQRPGSLPSSICGAPRTLAP